MASSQVPWELVPQPSLAVPLPPRRRWWQLWAKREGEPVLLFDAANSSMPGASVRAIKLSSGRQVQQALNSILVQAKSCYT